MNTRLSRASLSLLALAGVLAAQAPPIDWRTDVGIGVGLGLGIYGNFELDSTDHLYACPGGAIYKVVRVDPTGRLLWTREITGVGATKAFDVAVDSQDNAIAIGYDQGTVSYVTTKFDTAGNVLWKRVRKDGLGDEAFSVAVDAADNVYVTGHSTNPTTFQVEFMTVKYDPAGNELWGARGPVGQAMHIEVTPAGRVAVIGDAGGAFVTASYDTDGNQLWSDYFSPALDRPADLVIADDGSVLVCGKGGPGFTGVVVRYSPTGTIDWVANHTSPFGGSDSFRAMTLDPAGNVVVVGDSYGGGTVTKFDPSGGFLWSRTNHIPGMATSAYDLTTDAAGNIYVSGGVGPDNCPIGLPRMDSGLLSYAADGTLLWEQQVSCSNSETGTVAIDARGGILYAAWDELIRLDPSCPSQAGAEVVRLGTPPNPNAFRPGMSGPPTIGQYWDPIIDHTSFVPQAMIDFIAVSTDPPVNVPLSFGTLLCAPPPANQLYFNSRSQRRVAVPIPGGCSLVGLVGCAQAGSYSGATGIRLANAIDFVIGS